MHEFTHRAVPDFRIHEFFPRRTRFCFMPVVYNEGERFRTQAQRMSARADLADVIVTARESTDGSTDPAVHETNGFRALLVTQHAGAASAIRAGFSFALAQGYDGVILIDGHNKDGVEALPAYIAKLEEGFDFVQGSRFMTGGTERNTPLARKIGIKYVMGPMLWAGTGFWYTDSTNGFRGYSRRFLEHARVEPFRECFDHLNLQYYLSYLAPKLGLNVVEIPVERVYPDDGTVPTKVVGFDRHFEALWEMVRVVRGKYDV